MSTMTDDEVFDSTVNSVNEWFYNDSGILESCLNKENELFETYEGKPVMCPFYIAFLELARVNVHKGWTKDELMRDIDDMLECECDEEVE